MIILLIHNYYKQRGGEDAVFDDECHELEKRGHKVIRYTKNNSATNRFSIKQKINFFKNAIDNKQTIRELNEIFKYNQIDIAHVHNVFPLISPVVYSFLKGKKIKIVQTIHNYRFLCPNGFFFIKNKICTKCQDKGFYNCIINSCYRDSFLLSILYAFIIKKYNQSFRNDIDAYIALTEFTKKTFVKYGYDELKFFVKGNGYNSTAKLRKKDKKYFLYLGRISDEKGIKFLLESFSKMTDYRLIIAGSGDDLIYYKTKFDSHNLEYIGYADGDKKNNLIIESIALIVPSIWYENFPITVVESFSCGIPVIASNTGGLPYIVEDKKSGLLFEKENFDDLKKKCDLLFNNEKLRNKLGDYALDYYKKNMNVKDNINKLIEIYKGLLHK